MCIQKPSSQNNGNLYELLDMTSILEPHCLHKGKEKQQRGGMYTKMYFGIQAEKYQYASGHLQHNVA